MRSPLPALLLLVVAVGAAVVWLLAEDAGSPEAQRAAPPSMPGVSAGSRHDGEPQSLSLPQPRADAVVPLVPPPARSAAGNGDTGTATDPDSAGPRTFTGRLLTPDGSPRADVEVAWLPSPATLLAAGLVETSLDPGQGPRRPLAKLAPLLASTRTNAEGRFSLTVELPGLNNTKQRAAVGPMLVVRCPDIMAFLAPIASDLGDIVVCSEGPFAVDVVDESGQPVVDAWAEVVVNWSRRPGCAGTTSEQGDPQHTFACGGVVVPLNATASVRFERDDLPSIFGNLVAGAPGYATVSRRLSADARTKPQEPLVLPPAGRFTGRVLAPDGAPLPGALVTITHEPGTHYPLHHGTDFRADDDALLLALSGAHDWSTSRTLTDEDGRFAYLDLPANTHDIFVQAPGYQPLRERDVLPDGPPIELRLERERRLEVSVRDSQGNPVDGARVEAWRGVMLDPNVLRVEAPSDPAQPFVVRGASERVTSVRATAPWHGTITEQALDGAGSMRLVLPPAGAVEVIVRDAGEPLADIDVWAVAPMKDGAVLFGNGQATTGTDGVARISNLEPGVLEVHAATEWNSRSLEFGEPVIVEVRARELSKVILDARHKAVVRGTVVGAGAGVRVRFERDGGYGSSARTSDEGRFTVQLAADTYDVRVDGELVATLTLATGEERDIELPAARGARIEGRLTSGGRPMPGWTFSVSGATKVPDQITDDHGRFVVELPAAGRWTPRFSLRAEKRVRRQGPRLDALEIEPGGVALLDVDLPSASITVRAVDGDGSPVSKLAVTFRRVDDDVDPFDKLGLRVSLDSRGVARAEWLSPGTWLVEVTHGWTWQEQAGEPFELAEAEASIQPDLVLQRACTVEGQAWAAPGVPVGDDVKVLFINSAGDREDTYIDSRGNYDISWLPHGRWQVVLIGKGRRLDLTPIDVPPGAGRTIDLAPGDELELDLVMPPLR